MKYILFEWSLYYNAMIRAMRKCTNEREQEKNIDIQLYFSEFQSFVKPSVSENNH